MPGHREEKKVTIQAAADILRVSEESVRRYINKGLLSELCEGSQVYVSIDDVKALRQEFVREQNHWMAERTQTNGRGETPARHQDETVTLETERYEALLIELGELRKESQFLSEYRQALHEKERELKHRERELEELKEILLETEWKDYELDQAQKRIYELEADLKQIRTDKPWWKRWLG